MVSVVVLIHAPVLVEGLVVLLVVGVVRVLLVVHHVLGLGLLWDLLLAVGAVHAVTIGPVLNLLLLVVLILVPSVQELPRPGSTTRTQPTVSRSAANKRSESI